MTEKHNASIGDVKTGVIGPTQKIQKPHTLTTITLRDVSYENSDGQEVYARLFSQQLVALDFWELTTGDDVVLVCVNRDRNGYPVWYPLGPPHVLAEYL